MVATSRTGRRSGAVLLIDQEGHLAGLFTDSDLARLFEKRQETALDGPIRQVMTVHPLVVREGELGIDELVALGDDLDDEDEFDDFDDDDFEDEALDDDLDEATTPFGNVDDLAIGAVGNEAGKLLVVQGPLSTGGGVLGDGVYREESSLLITPIVGEKSGDFFGFSAGHHNDYFDSWLERNGEPLQASGYITEVLTEEARRLSHLVGVARRKRLLGGSGGA